MNFYFAFDQLIGGGDTRETYLYYLAIVEWCNTRSSDSWQLIYGPDRWCQGNLIAHALILRGIDTAVAFMVV